ncbi:MAG: glycosyltransferase [Planctomycetes bacterium]|nr:glycosyltransferase [Planctomycetota bacterium]
MQSDQEFGVIILDDASSFGLQQCLYEETAWLGSRLTLVRHHLPQGRMRNSVLAIRDLCGDPDACIVVVDLDDALADPEAIRGVRRLKKQGYDVMLAAPFRPDVLTRFYTPDFQAPRSRFGGDVWSHLRAFENRLFDQLPDDALQLDGEWLRQCDDYAIMIPVVELTRSPVYVPEYWYWRERSTGHDSREKASRDVTIMKLLAKPSLIQLDKQTALE